MKVRTVQSCRSNNFRRIKLVRFVNCLSIFTPTYFLLWFFFAALKVAGDLSSYTRRFSPATGFNWKPWQWFPCNNFNSSWPIVFKIFYFFHFADFSLTNWGSTRDLDLTSLIDLYIHKFYDDADIGWYLQFPSCDRNDSPFGPSANGWNNCKLLGLGVIMFKATFNNISVISWQSVLLVEETRENNWPAASLWQTLSHNVVWSTPHH